MDHKVVAILVCVVVNVADGILDDKRMCSCVSEKITTVNEL